MLRVNPDRFSRIFQYDKAKAAQKVSTIHIALKECMLFSDFSGMICSILKKLSST
jgi:hypothetical protein